MSISSELFMAILSMDAYNRGYHKGYSVPGNQVGDASVVPRDTYFDDIKYAAWQAASFYAVAYDWNGETEVLPDYGLAGAGIFRSFGSGRRGCR
ncbi:hypothetical protein [Rhizobium paknamense]|uniref:Uncharacterized protein n=1 Tax=Rhizobium paknamense TaxID=1206817 RepID=A0ABU0IFX3_9HYPH|nr:hypothetical protein [Rhizobium paknamense]MDQ0457168.1 hypothetical protein [Rhizobium paknamense]